MTLLSDQADAVRALVESADPGAVWAVGGPDGLQAGSDTADAPDTVFDVGGLTAVLALWPVVGSLVDEGALRLHTPLAAYGDAAAAGTPAGTTAHQLLTHPAGTAALTRLAEHLSGSPLADLAAVRVWRPLGMAGTRFADGTLRAPLADLVRFLRHLLAPEGPEGPAAPADPEGPAGADAADPDGARPITRAWTAESLRIRTGELTPARGLLWQPAPRGVWAHHAPTDPARPSGSPHAATGGRSSSRPPPAARSVPASARPSSLQLPLAEAMLHAILDPARQEVTAV
ncbi:hypothetical protein WKI68_01935 [Streptomyces sp. MS1.HAVA.3]|uniref:Beta-lactamase n=1 Tax=Streptomyces caledonius TaxID=3134107 RepID=A0ABU8TY36_9ACTN